MHAWTWSLGSRWRCQPHTTFFGCSLSSRPPNSARFHRSIFYSFRTFRSMSAFLNLHLQLLHNVEHLKEWHRSLLLHPSQTRFLNSSEYFNSVTLQRARSPTLTIAATFSLRKEWKKGKRYSMVRMKMIQLTRLPWCPQCQWIHAGSPRGELLVVIDCSGPSY